MNPYLSPDRRENMRLMLAELRGEYKPKAEYFLNAGLSGLIDHETIPPRHLHKTLGKVMRAMHGGDGMAGWMPGYYQDDLNVALALCRHLVGDHATKVCLKAAIDEPNIGYAEPRGATLVLDDLPRALLRAMLGKMLEKEPLPA